MWFRRLSLALCLTAQVWAQRLEKPVASLNGQPLSAGDVERLLAGLPYLDQQAIGPKQMLEERGLKQLLAAEANKEKLQERSPYQESIEYDRWKILAIAAQDYLKQQIQPTPEDVRKFYEENRDRYDQIRFKLLYIGFSPKDKPERSEEEAKRLADEVKAKIDAGADFVEMVKQYSEAKASRERGGDFATPVDRFTEIKGYDQVVTTLFQLLPGVVSQPVREKDGYYLFRVETRQPKPFDEVKDDVRETLREMRRDQKLGEIRQAIKVHVVVPAYFPEAAKPGASAKPAVTVEPETVVATIDNRKFTAALVDRLINSLPPEERRRATDNKVKTLEGFGLLMRLSALAEEAKLDQQSPYRERLEYARLTALAQAQIDETSQATPVTPEQQRKQYDENPERYTQVRVRGIYLPFGTQPAGASGKKLMTEEEAKAKAESVTKQARDGADFLKLVKEYSEDESKKKDGEFTPIRKSDRIPEEIKNVLFSHKQGEITDPIRAPNGYYVFRIEESGVIPYDKIRDDIYLELKQQGFEKYLNALRAKVELKILDEDFFRAHREGARMGPTAGKPQ